jgi:N-acyl-D-amino-acid deacylase
VADHELVIRGGDVVDGTGAPRRRADVGIDRGIVRAIAPGLRGDRELDASGALVCPGFLDVHTHYDPQVLWDPWLTPSCHQGVTTVVAGNCGFSIAPCPPEMRGSLMRTLELVEDMRLPTLEAGVDWSFATYPEYLERVGRRGTAINFGGYVGHTAVRLWAMGDDAYERDATDDELTAMRAIVAEAIRAGAMGFSSDRSGFHRGDGGRMVPSIIASQAEVEALMSVTADLGQGIVHCAPGERYAWLYEFQPRLGRPITWSAILTYPRGAATKAFWGDKLAVHAAGIGAGADVHPQVTSRPVTFRITMAAPAPLIMVPAFAELVPLDDRARSARYTDPAWRERARREIDTGGHVDVRWDAFAVAESVAHPELVGPTIAELAAHRGVHPLDVVLDVALADELGARFVVTFANDDVDGVTALLQADGCVLGLSDAGAHVGQLCDAAMPTDFLARWVRDRSLMTPEAGIRRLTGELADLLEIPHRGHLRPGAAADVTVLDWDRLDPGPLRRVRDFPGEGDRLVADEPQGVVHVVVNGTPIRVDERPLVDDPSVERDGRLPGRLPRAPAGV